MLVRSFSLVACYRLIVSHFLYGPYMLSHTQRHHGTSMSVFPIPRFYPKRAMIPTEIVIRQTEPAMTGMVFPVF